MASYGRKRQRKEINHIHIPHDLTIDILANLPVKSLLRFKCISKHWHSLINSPSFIELHLSNQEKKDPRIFIASACQRRSTDISMDSIAIEEYKEARIKVATHDVRTMHNIPRDWFHMLHSCDGIVCFHGNLYIHVYNPSTREFRTLPEKSHLSPICFKPNNIDDDNDKDNHECEDHNNNNYNHEADHGYKYWPCQLVGFGRDQVTKEYKIIRLFIQQVEFNKWFIMCEIFTLSPNPKASWRGSGAVPYRIVATQRPAYFNGALHWLTVVKDYPKRFEAIVAFDLHTEKFQEIPLPNCDSDPTNWVNPVELMTLRRCLCLAELDYSKSLLNIWILKDYYSPPCTDRGVWEKMFVINLQLMDAYSHDSLFVNLIAEHKDGTISICQSREKLYVYDPKSKSFSYVVRGTEYPFMSSAYVESLVPIYGKALISYD